MSNSMKRLSAFLSVLALLFILCHADAKPRKNYDVYLLIGQSNMAGRGEMMEADKIPMEGVWLLDAEGNIVPATAPLNRYSTIRKKAGVQKYSLGYSFALEMSKKSRRDILLVVQARGGSGMRAWLQGAERKVFNKEEGDEPRLWGKEQPEYFTEAVRRTKQAMKYGKLKGILWHQGEADAGVQSSAVYVERLCAFVSDLRNCLGVSEKVPFVCGEVCRDYHRSGNINPELNRAAVLIPHAFCVSSEGCPAKSDKVHFSREGCVIMGQRYAECF